MACLVDSDAALYTVGPEYFDAVRKEYKARRDTLVEGLKKMPRILKMSFLFMSRLPPCSGSTDQNVVEVLEEQRFSP